MNQEYHKINSVYKRDLKGKFIDGDFAIEEIAFLKDLCWVWTEKVDGTNIRLYTDTDVPGKLFVGGRTNNAQIPVPLLDKLDELITPEKFFKVFPTEPDLCLYGEGYGAKIQKGGGNYIKDGVSFVLFDVKIDNWWLKREDVEEIANELGIQCVPVVGEGTISEAIEFVKAGFNSRWGNFQAEGIVLRPKVELRTRGGARVITKLKYKDFK